MVGQLAQDTYIRADAGSWGNASDGQTWTGDTFFASISSNTGLLSTGSPSAFPQLRLGSKAAVDMEVLARVSLGHLSNIVTINSRVQSSGNYYCAALSSSALQIQVVAGFGATMLATTAVSPVAGSFYWVRFRAIGTSLYVNFWLDGTSEPGGWTLTNSGDTTYSGGGCGILAGLNTTTPVSINSFTASILPRIIPCDAALLATNTRTIPSTAALLATNTRTIPSTAALLQTNTRTIPSDAALLQVSTRTIPSSAALLQTSTRTVPSTAALLATNSRVIPSDAALLQTSSRSIPSSAALLQTNTRTIPSDAALLQASIRNVPCSAALLATKHRTIPCTAALSGVAPVITPNATFYVRSGDATCYVRSGDAIFYVR